MDEKVICPYCSIELVKGEEADDVYRCNINGCSEIMCELCFARHVREVHPYLALKGKLNDKGQFMVANYQLCED